MADPYQFPPSSETQGNSAKTGMLLIGGVFGCMVVMIALLIAYTFGLERPAQAQREVTYIAQTIQARTDPRIQVPEDWAIILEEDFSDSESWAVGTHTLESATYKETIRDGALEWEVDIENTSYSSLWYDIPPIDGNTDEVQDFIASVDAAQIEGLATAGKFGIVYRAQEENYYVFAVDQSGRYDVLLHTPDRGVLPLLRQWARLPNGSRPERLAMRAEGSHFTFFINDSYVNELEHHRLPSGKIGLIVEAFPTDKHIRVVFDNFLIAVP